MNLDLIVGLIVSGVPLLIIGYLMLKRQPGIYRMFVAMVLVGLGYLTATGAMTDIGHRIVGETEQMADKVAPQPVKSEAPAPAAATPAEPPAAQAPAEPPAAPEDTSGEPPPAPDMPETDAPPPPAEGETPAPAEPAPAQ